MDLFTPFKSVFLKFGNVSTDNFVFRMHYRFTTVMLLVFTLLVTSKQFFGDPIHCMNSGDNSDKDAINSYCWIYGTYTLKSQAHHATSYAGVGTQQVGDEIIKHTYYQWVCFVLLGQAVMFYIPRYLWKMWEAGRLKALVGDLNGPIVPKEWKLRRDDLVTYLHNAYNHAHSTYAMKYAFCEVLNFVNAIGQIFLLDRFLGGAFRNYGAAVSSFTQIPRLPNEDLDFSKVNPMDEFFPKLTKCWFRSFGPSGSVEFKDRLCVLPLNIVNEKIFVILWFWLIFLSIISGLAIICRVSTYYLNRFRSLKIYGRLRHVDRNSVYNVVDHMSYGDWFVLHLMSKNMNPIAFKDLMVELAQDLDERKGKIYPNLMGEN